MKLLLSISLFLLMTTTALAAPPSPAPEEIQRFGEKMYREGVLPDGQPMKAFVADDVPVDGTAFTCVSCHLRSGLGSVEGEVVTPPTNGRVLYRERKPFVEGAAFVPSYSNFAKYLPERPAYTDATLGTLISAGVDPTGRSVLRAMPRYELDDNDMAIMIAYLKTLSDQPPPGVGEKQLRFASVIVEGADPVAVKSMLLPLQFSVDRKNSLATAAKANNRVARMAYNMLGDLHGYSFSFSKWTLTGPPETWRAQLDAYYAREPVFALLGGISPGTWEPVHRFCEENRIPDIFPIVDQPVLSDSDWYTLYPSRGFRQEGESAARYLNGMAELFKERPIIQVVRSNARGMALADGFRTIWADTGHPPVIEVSLPVGESLTAARLQQLAAEHNPAVLLVWDDAAALPAIGGLLGKAGEPGLVFVSGPALGKALWTVPEPLRELLYITWPYRLPHEDARFDVAVRKVLAGKKAGDYDPVILRQSFIAGEILGNALMEMRGEYYRDFLFDAIGMMPDMYYPLYERVSFGPGQRYAAKGCFITQLGKGEKPRLEKRSEWVVQ